MIIGRLTGTVAALGTDNILIDVNGVGYVCMAGTRLLSRVHVGETSVLHVETKGSHSTPSALTRNAPGSFVFRMCMVWPARPQWPSLTQSHRQN